MVSRTKQVSSSRGRGPRLGTQIRGDMAAAYSARGSSSADLALHYSPKAKKDVALTGILQFLNFLYCEIDSNVTAANYAPYPAIAASIGEPLAALVDVEITFRDGAIKWRRLIQTAPDDASLVEELRARVGTGLLAHVSQLEVWTHDDLTANPVRIRNALRVTSWMAAARYWPLDEFKSKILALMQRQYTVTFRDVLNLESGSRQALTGAAILEMACSGTVRSDLMEVPLHGMSLFHRIGD